MFKNLTHERLKGNGKNVRFTPFAITQSPIRHDSKNLKFQDGALKGGFIKYGNVALKLLLMYNR